MGPNYGWHTVAPNALLESWSDLRAPLTNRLIDLGSETMVAPKAVKTQPLH
jgi:hypothetical protein